MNIDEKYIRLQLDSAYSLGAIAAFDRCNDSSNPNPSDLKAVKVEYLLEMLRNVARETK